MANRQSNAGQKTSQNSLVLASQVLLPCIDGQSNLTANLANIANTDTAKRQADFSQIKALCFGTARFYHRIKLVKAKLIAKPIAKKDADLDMLLSVAMFQLCEGKTPDYAVVNNCVQASKEINKTWAKALINGVLRNFIRKYRDALVKKEFEKISQKPSEIEILRFSHPYWFIEKIKKTYPEDYEQILLANNCKPPITLRLNQGLTSKEEYSLTLQKNEIEHRFSAFKTAIYLTNPLNVEDIPNFFDGLVSLQDEVGQILPEMMQLEPGQKVLDACSAPGGKTSAMLEFCSELDILALDKDASRLQRVDENLQRLNLSARTMAADFLELPASVQDEKFDRILLDAPCSATGIIRRHADIKLMRQSADIKKFAKQQLQMLEVGKKLLKRQGLFVYSTCSILVEENREVVQKFLQQNTDMCVDLDSIKANKDLANILKYAHIDEYGMQFLPRADFTDGFFYSILRFKS